MKVTGPNTHVVPGDIVYTVDTWSTMYLMCPNDIRIHEDVYNKNTVSLKTYTPCTVIAVIIYNSFNSNLFYVHTPDGFGWLKSSDVAPFVTANEPNV